MSSVLRSPTSTAEPAREPTTPGGDSDIAAVGALVADPGRCRMLLALDDGRALPASRLAAEAGVSAATGSSHLRKLTDSGLLAVEVHGRHRYYRLAGPQVAHLIEALQQLAPPAPIRSLRQSTRASALREARTCYDHVAGRLGVAIMARLLDAGHLSGGDGTHDPDRARDDGRTGYGRDIDYTLTDTGQRFLADLDVQLPPDRPAVRYCIDWSEQRHHLAGALGKGLLDRLLELGWIERHQSDRAVTITMAGRAGLTDALGLNLQPVHHT